MSNTRSNLVRMHSFNGRYATFYIETESQELIEARMMANEEDALVQDAVNVDA